MAFGDTDAGDRRDFNNHNGYKGMLKVRIWFEGDNRILEVRMFGMLLFRLTQECWVGEMDIKRG